MVMDPIIKSSSVHDLIDAVGLRLLVERLLPLATVVTPNVDVAAALTGLKVTDLEQMRVAVTRLHEMGAASVVITGGHLEKAIDLLSFASRTGPQQEVFKSTKLASKSTHGTGCAASPRRWRAIWRKGEELPEAVLLAKTYVAAAIANAYPLGRGVGPVHHLYLMYQHRRVASARDQVGSHNTLLVRAALIQQNFLALEVRGSSLRVSRRWRRLRSRPGAIAIR